MRRVRDRVAALLGAVLLTATLAAPGAATHDGHRARKATFALKAKFAKNAGKLDGLDSTAFALVGDLTWDGLAGIPAGFADGIDADSGGDITAVTAGTGLNGGGTSGAVTLDVDTTAIQQRVSGSCAAGSSVRAIDASGAVTCESDDTSSLPAYCALLAEPASYAPCAGFRTVLDQTGMVGRQPSIAIAPDGNPIISYYDDTNDDLKVVACTDPACTGGDEAAWVVDGTGLVGGHSSIAIGADGLPVISYWDETGESLNVAHCGDPSCAGGNETLSTVDAVGTEADPTAYSSLAIGADGLPVIAYRHAADKSLRVAKCNDLACAGSNETITTVDNTNDSTGRFVSIAIGADGLPIIGYRDDGGFAKAAKCDDPACTGGGEVISVVDITPMQDVGYSLSLAVAPDGLPILSYHAAAPAFNDLRVAKCNDAACAGGDETKTSIDTVGDVGSGTSIEIGVDGLPLISYYDITNGDLKLARCSNASCTAAALETVDAAGDVGGQTSLVIGVDGFPVIAYLDDGNDDLKAARVAG